MINGPRSQAQSFSMRQGVFLGVTIAVSMAVGRLASDATRDSLGYTLSVLTGIGAAALAAIVVVLAMQRFLSPVK